jgi:cytoskeletal protein CcmA (bactofilin family)
MEKRVPRISRHHLSSRPNNRGSIFLSAMIALIVLLALGVTFVEMSIQEVTRASREKKETRALSLAEAGLDYAAWHVYNQPPTGYPFTLARADLPEGIFSAVVDRYRDGSGNLIPNGLKVVSTGTCQGFNAEVKAVGTFVIPPEYNSNVFTHALFSDSDLTVLGTANIYGSIHSNGNMSLQGTPLVTGDASAVGWIKDPKSSVEGIKTPNAARETMPTIDIQYYRANANTVLFGDQTLSGTIKLNGITFIDGDVHVTGQVDGKGVIVATGSILVNGHVTLANSDSEFALISTQMVRTNGNCRVEGVIYTHNAQFGAFYTGNGTADIVGAVVADVITCNGTLNVTYKQPTVPLPGNQNSPIQVDLISWRRLK